RSYSSTKGRWGTTSSHRWGPISTTPSVDGRDSHYSAFVSGQRPAPACPGAGIAPSCWSVALTHYGRVCYREAQSMFARQEIVTAMGIPTDVCSSHHSSSHDDG